MFPLKIWKTCHFGGGIFRQTKPVFIHPRVFHGKSAENPGGLTLSVFETKPGDVEIPGDFSPRGCWGAGMVYPAW